MHIKLFCLLSILKYIQCLPLNVGATQGASLQLPLPPTDFTVDALTGGEQYAVPAAQLLLNVIFLGWTSNDATARIALLASFEDPSFDWEFSIAVERSQASQYANLQTVSWAAIRIVEGFLSNMQLYQDTWTFPKHGYILRSSHTLVGDCSMLPRDTTNSGLFNVSTNHKQGPANVTIDNNTTSLAVLLYIVQVYGDGPVIPKKAVLWLLWGYLDTIFGMNSQDRVEAMQEAGSTYSSDSYERFRLTVTYDQVRIGRRFIRWYDVAQSINFLFDALNDAPRWTTFHGESTLIGTRFPFLKFSLQVSRSSDLATNGTSVVSSST